MSYATINASLEWLEHRVLLTSVSFVKQLVDPIRTDDLFPADIDADGDLDLAGSGRGEVFWLENDNGAYGPRRTVSGTGPVGAIYAGDVDGDGDTDVVAGQHIDLANEGQLVWFENLDARGGSFTEKKVISEGVNEGANDLGGADFDKDGDLDLVAAFSWEIEEDVYGSKVAWFENTDGKGTFEQRLISDDARGVHRISIHELNEDGYPDVLTNIGWFRNPGGGGGGFDQFNFFGQPFASGDLDGDGDPDVLSSTAGQLLWEVNEGDGKFFREHVISEDPGFVVAGEIVDLDLDADNDVVVGIVGDSRIAWYENTDGNGNFSAQRPIDSRTRPSVILAIDADDDGDQDLFATTTSDLRDQLMVHLYENLVIPKPGDANRDGVFNSADLVQVFQAGEYEDEIEGNSTFEEGDFDGDGDFTTSDLVFVFQADTFVNTARKDIASALAFPDEELRRRKVVDHVFAIGISGNNSHLNSGSVGQCPVTGDGWEPDALTAHVRF